MVLVIIYLRFVCLCACVYISLGGGGVYTPPPSEMLENPHKLHIINTLSQKVRIDNNLSSLL